MKGHFHAVGSSNASDISKRDYFLFAVLIMIGLLLVIAVAQLGSIQQGISDLNKVMATAGTSGTQNAQNQAGTPSQNAAGTQVNIKSASANISVGNSPYLGNKTAKVTVIAFSDFQCPYCMRFENTTFPQLKKEYIDTGKIQFVFKQLPLSFHPFAQKAAEASLCAKAQNKFWEMHNLLFTKGVTGGVDSYKEYAKSLKLNMTKFNTCLDTNQTASTVKAEAAQGSSAGITGTPSFVINGKVLVGAQSIDAFKVLIDGSLAGK